MAIVAERATQSAANDASRLRSLEIVRVATSGLRARRTRAVMSCLGIAIGIASLVAVLGLSESSKSDLLDQLDALGTNLLTVSPGQGFGVGDSSLPDTAVAMTARLPTVESASAVSDLDLTVYRNEFVPIEQTGALSVRATDEDLLATLNNTVAEGTFLTGGGSDFPVVVLGAVAAERLGITSLDQPVAIVLGDQRVEVVGILDMFPLDPDLDRTVFVSTAAATDYLVDDEITPSIVYLRTEPGSVEPTREILPATVDPENPEEVEVARPSDVLEAQSAAESSFTSLFLGLGLVALIVGGIGIANVMVIGVIERRGEIGLRRSIGATRRHIRLQFLCESLLLGLAGGVVGVTLGILITVGYASAQGWRSIVPPLAPIAGLGAAIAIGVIAGLYPAARAARMAPTEALRAD
jgi:putative ABC transport system permease protein